MPATAKRQKPEWVPSVLYSVPIDRIHPGKNPRKRFDEESLAELAQSIREVGLLQPLLLTPATDSEYDFRIVAGERRWRAAQLAALKEVPAVVQEMTAAQEVEVALIENLQRQDLDPIEEAEAYRALIKEHGYTQEALGEKLGVSQSQVANRLRLTDLPEAVQRDISGGVLSASHGKILATYKDLPAKFLTEVARELQERHVPVSEAADTVQHRIIIQGKPLVGDAYSTDSPHFSTKECNPCNNRVMAKRWGDEKPYCMDVECWNRKQAEAHQQAVAKAEKAGKAGDFVDLAKLKYGDYEYWYENSGSPNCAECGKRRLGKKQNQKAEEARMICLDPACMRNKRDQADKARKKAETEKREADRESVRHLVEARVNRMPVPDWDALCMTVPFGQEDLVYLAARLLNIGSNSNDPAVQADRYLKKRFGVKVDWKSHEAMRNAWPKMRDALESLSNKQLVTIIFEWLALARGFEGPEAYLLKSERG